VKRVLETCTDDGQIAKQDTAIKKIKRVHVCDLGPEEVALQKQLSEWRNTFTIQQAKTEGKSVKQQFTLGVLCSGGCLDTLAGMRAGFKAVWSSEISASQSRMFEDLTGGSCLFQTLSAPKSGMLSASTILNQDNPALTTHVQDLNWGVKEKQGGCSSNKQRCYYNCSHGPFAWKYLITQCT
jgi:hypothetical protein